MLDAAGIGAKAFVLGQVGAARRRAELAILPVRADAHGDASVGCGEGLVGDDAGMGVAVARRRFARGQVVVRHIRQPRDLGVEQRHVDELAAAAALALVQRGQDRRRRKEAGL